MHKKIGTKKFFLKLKKLDPLIINNILPTDTQRCIRAYEVKKYTKKSIYEWSKKTKSDFENKDFYKIYIEFPRKELIERIKLRTKNMINNGIVQEVKKLKKLKVPKNNTAMKAIGIKEVDEYISKKIEISELNEKISIKTRQYAKRQSTWGRGHMSDWNKMNPKSLNNFLKKV